MMTMATSISISPPEALVRFAHRRARLEEHKPNVERRSVARQSLTTPALLQPVNSELDIVGAAIPAMTRDISRDGVGVIVECLPQHRLFAVHFVVDDEATCLLASAKWTEHDGPFEYIGFRALAVLETPPTVDAHMPQSQSAFCCVDSLAT